MRGAPGRHVFYAAFDDSAVEIRRRSKLYDEGAGVVKVTHGKEEREDPTRSGPPGKQPGSHAA